MKAAPAPSPELWIGPEPSVVRIGERRTDQLGSTGFAQRLDDLDRLAGLGARRVRMPLLWERTETASGELDFTWADSRLERLQALALPVIAGLVHHGSGPLHTHLLDPAFPGKLADYARRVAERYPWIDAWTPVNEPLTTARFSGLYGLWYPHGRDDASFVRALLHEVLATQAAMRAIRRVNPQALLVQTEDLGRTSGTPVMDAQVQFDNERRWLSLDLLAGRVDAHHPMRDYLRQHGASEQALDTLQDDPCLRADDILGINHYVTSDRFLDHRTRLYPPHTHGGNGRQAYADVEAVRVAGAALGGFEARLREAVARLGRPVAITEVQLSCTREEQLRWFYEAWRGVEQLRGEGLDVRAVTAWAAFGAHDWDSLLTQARGVYEPGLYDVRAPQPRRTALGRLAAELGAGQPPSSPVLHMPGWWHRQDRHTYEPHGRVQALPPLGPPLLITGGRGTLAQAFARLCRRRGLPYRLLQRHDLDIADTASVAAALARWSPWAVVNAAGYVRVDDAETDPRQWRENAEGPVRLAAECARAGVQLLTFSTDLVFGGQTPAGAPARPYLESDPVAPLNAYGRAKAHVEQALAGLPGVLVVRTAAFFGPWDGHNFLSLGLNALRHGQPWTALGDQVVSPTYVPDLVNTSLDLLIDAEQGLWHLANGGALSWYALACRAAEGARLPVHGVRRIDTAAAGQIARRPAYSALGSERAALMPTLDHALQRFIEGVDAVHRDTAPASDYGCEPARQAAVSGLSLPARRA